MRVSKASLEALEFDSLRRVAAEFAVTDLGRSRLAGTAPIDDPGELRRSILMNQAVERLLEDEPLVTHFDEDLAPLAEGIARERAEITGRDLLLLAVVLKSCRSALRRIESGEPEEGPLREAFVSIEDLSDLSTEIGRRLDERARVRDDASSRLAQLSKKSRRVRRGLYAKLGGFVAGHRERDRTLWRQTSVHRHRPFQIQHRYETA